MIVVELLLHGTPLLFRPELVQAIKENRAGGTVSASPVRGHCGMSAWLAGWRRRRHRIPAARLEEVEYDGRACAGALDLCLLEPLLSQLRVFLLPSGGLAK